MCGTTGNHDYDNTDYSNGHGDDGIIIYDSDYDYFYVTRRVKSLCHLLCWQLTSWQLTVQLSQLRQTLTDTDTVTLTQVQATSRAERHRSQQDRVT